MARGLIIAVGCLGVSAAALARDGGDGPFDARTITALPFVDVGGNELNDSVYDYECGGVPIEYDGKDQWYAIVATADMSVRITTCSPVTDYDTHLYVFRDSINHASVVACDGDSCFGGMTLGYVAEIEQVDLEAGHTYFIVVDAYSQSDEGTFELRVESLGVVGPSCPGDATGNGLVDVDDLNQILGAWQMTMPPGTGADLSGDGVVGVDDLNEVLSNWQNVCKS